MLNSQIRLVVFDMAGTTVRDRDNVHHALIVALASEGLTVSRDDANEVMGYPKPVAIEQLLRKYQRPAEADIIERAHRVFLDTMIDYYAHHPEVGPADGAEQVFGTLRAHGIKVGLDTGFSADIAGTIIERLGWADKIDAWVASDMVSHGRPHPDMIHRLMQATGVADVQQVAKVGDTPADLLEGTQTGTALVVGITTGAYQRHELEALPHTHLIDHLTELLPLLGL